MNSNRNSIRFQVVVVLVVLIFCGYGLHYYAYVLHENPSFKLSIKKPLITQFSNGDSRSDHSLGKQLNVYAINLDRSTDRWANLKPKLDGLNIPYHRLSAIDGRKIPSDLLRLNVDQNKFDELLGVKVLDAEIGCYLSHYFAIQHFLKSPSSYALILEDDMDFVPYELIQVIQDLLQDKDKWDIANLKTMKGHPKRVATLMHSKRSLVDFTANFWGAGAYLLNRKAGNALLKNSLPIIMPYDWYFQRDWEFGVKFRGVSPSPFDTTGGTTIQEKRVPAESISSLMTSSFFKGSAIAVRRLRF